MNNRNMAIEFELSVTVRSLFLLPILLAYVLTGCVPKEDEEKPDPAIVVKYYNIEAPDRDWTSPAQMCRATANSTWERAGADYSGSDGGPSVDDSGSGGDGSRGEDSGSSGDGSRGEDSGSDSKGGLDGGLDDASNDREYCGDGVVDLETEACDDGVNDNRYDGCSRDCQSLGPHCGDGVINGSESCDPPGDCPTETECVANGCEVLEYSGDPESCDAKCEVVGTITSCLDSDGCCPSGCIRSDDDCPVPCIDGMIGYWRAEGDATDSEAKNHGTLQGGATYASGKVGQAFSLGGSNQHVAITPSTYPHSAGGVTVEAWINPKQASGYQWIYTQYPDGPQLGLVYQTAVVWRPNADTGGSHTLVQNVPLNDWTYVAATFDGSSAIVYINGISAGSESRSGVADLTNPAYIGKRLNQEYFVGRIDEVAVYDRALSPAEVLQHYVDATNGDSYCP